jgi:hypothetical protein
MDVEERAVGVEDEGLHDFPDVKLV